MTLMKAINEKVYKIIGSCMEVHRTLGPGYSVDFYKKGLEVEFPLKELPFESKKTLQVIYKDVLVGTLEIDFVIDGDVVLMIRSQDGLKDSEIQQVLRCITMTEAAMGILVNFGLSKIQYKRVVPSQQQKEFRKDIYHVSAYRQLGKTREGNPAV